MPRWFLSVMTVEHPARLILAAVLLSGLTLPAAAQLTGSRPLPLPQSEASPAPGQANLDQAILQPSSPSEVLRVEEAFQLTGLFEGDSTLLLSWVIAPGHYLYRDHFEFHAAGQTISADLPPAATLTDEYFGETSVYFDALQLRFPLKQVPQSAEGDYRIEVTYQGCAKDKYCYPPSLSEISLRLPD